MHSQLCIHVHINEWNIILLLFWHNVPLKPFGQEQVKNGLESDVEHMPKFRHGFGLQGAAKIYVNLRYTDEGKILFFNTKKCF